MGCLPTSSATRRRPNVEALVIVLREQPVAPVKVEVSQHADAACAPHQVYGPSSGLLCPNWAN